MKTFFTPREYKPEGWIKKQLRIEAEGLAGNLDKVWPDVRDSAWIGGDREGWERVPYWLDGFIPLAWLLDDEDMKARAVKYIDAILLSQQPDGWICPCPPEARPTYDSWAVQLISKVLTVYYRCSGDVRIPPVIEAVLKNYYELLKAGTIRLFNWGKSRWFETFVAMNFLWDRTHGEWLRDLARILKDQGADYESFIPLWKTPLNKWKHETHIVNIGMMLKYEAISHKLLGEPLSGKADLLWDTLSRYNGTVTDLFTGDEVLSGLGAVHGTELCSVVEAMYSYEWLYAATGEVKWAERLETAAFNALPATISEDMWTHQYDQQVNQIGCQKYTARSPFRTNGGESAMFGLEPNYGCCTANMGQGWPKLALFSFLRDGDGIEQSLLLPGILDCGQCRIEVRTDYPFKNSAAYTVDAKEDFAFQVRIPSFAENLTVDGRQEYNSGMLSFDFKAGEHREFRLCFDTEIATLDRPYGLTAVKKGSLVFALPIAAEWKPLEYERKGVERKFPYCDYELAGKSDWAFRFENADFTFCENAVSDIPFSQENPPLTLEADLTPIRWGYLDGYETICDLKPKSAARAGKTVRKTLIPYGCARLRMTEMPMKKK